MLPKHIQTIILESVDIFCQKSQQIYKNAKNGQLLSKLAPLRMSEKSYRENAYLFVNQKLMRIQDQNDIRQIKEN